MKGDNGGQPLIAVALEPSGSKRKSGHPIENLLPLGQRSAVWLRGFQIRQRELPRRGAQVEVLLPGVGSQKLLTRRMTIAAKPMTEGGNRGDHYVRSEVRMAQQDYFCWRPRLRTTSSRSLWGDVEWIS